MTAQLHPLPKEQRKTMKRSRLPYFGRTLQVAVGVVGTSLLLIGCSGSTRSTTTPAVTGPPLGSSSAPATPQQTPSVSTVPGLAVTSVDGYKYDVTVVSHAEGISTAAVAGRIGGQSGTVDAPPGSQFIAVTIAIKNPTNQQEPLESLATTDYQRAFIHLAIPMADAIKISGLNPTYDCNTVTDPHIPADYCALDTFRGSVSPESGLLTTEIASGATYRVQLVAGVDHANGATEGYKTPLPLQNVTTFVEGKTEEQLH
jgi:hypothetical protein